MADKSEPPECVKDGWWQGGCFCLDKVGVLCSTAVQTENPGHMLDRYRRLTSSNLSLPPLSPSFPPSLAYPSFPQHIYFPLFFPLSLFRLPLSFSLFISQFLFPPHVFWCLGLCVFPLCISLAPFCVCVFFFPLSSSVFLTPPPPPSISFALSQPLGPQWQASHRAQHKEWTKGRPWLHLRPYGTQGLMGGETRETTTLLRKGKCYTGLSQHPGRLT